MYQVVRVMLAAFVAVALVHTSGAATAQPVGMPPAIKQIQLTEKQIEAFIAAQKDMSPVLEKVQGAASEQLPPQLQAELDAAAKKHGFKDFNDYDEVTSNITMVMTGMDAKTKVFTDPAIAIKEEIQEVTANKALPAEERKQMLEELNEALKAAQPIQFPGNIDLVKKHYDKIDAAVN
jgi:homoserine dehydrogenase